MQDDTTISAGLGTASPAVVAGSWLDIGLAEDGTAPTVVLTGDLDLDSAPRLRVTLDRLVARGERDIVVDVSALHFCGAVGMGILVATTQTLPPDGVLTLTGASGMLRRLLHVTGVDEVVRVAPAAVTR